MRIHSCKFIFNIMVEAYKVHPNIMVHSFPQTCNLTFLSQKTKDRLSNINVKTKARLLDVFVYQCKESKTQFHDLLRSLNISPSETRYIVNHVSFAVYND